MRSWNKNCYESGFFKFQIKAIAVKASVNPVAPKAARWLNAATIESALMQGKVKGKGGGLETNSTLRVYSQKRERGD